MKSHPLARVAAAAVLTACGAPTSSPATASSSSPAARSPSGSASPAVAEASARVERHVRNVAASIPGAGLEVESPLRDSPCTAPVAGGPPGHVNAGVANRVTGLAPEHNPAAFDVAKRYWSDNRFRILLDARPRDHYLYVKAPAPDCTTVSLQESGDGTHILFLVADSPYLLPDGTGAPT